MLAILAESVWTVCFSERLEKEREILEERADKRVEILKSLVSKTVDLSAASTDQVINTQDLHLHALMIIGADY